MRLVINWRNTHHTPRALINTVAIASAAVWVGRHRSSLTYLFCITFNDYYSRKRDGGGGKRRGEPEPRRRRDTPEYINNKFPPPTYLVILLRLPADTKC